VSTNSKAPRARRRPPAPLLDDGNLQLLAMLAQQRVAVTIHAERWLGLGPRATASRLARLHDAGLIGRQGIFKGQPDAIWITRQGLGAAGSTLPPPGRPDLREYRHSLGVAWLWQDAIGGAFGELAGVVSERQMRSADYALDRLPQAERALVDDPALPHGIGIGTLGPDSRSYRHYPDLLLNTRGGQRIAVELELTPKSNRRLDDIMLGYASDGRIGAALYLVPDSKLADKIAAAARRAGIEDLVAIRRLGPAGIVGAPEPGPASRSPTRSVARSASRSQARSVPRSTEASR
jgi:hypothetical protein